MGDNVWEMSTLRVLIPNWGINYGSNAESN